MRTPPLILIVDDNPASREILQARLGAHDYDTITASDGEEGLNLARQELPDLILLDIMMPKMNGIEVCRHLKGDPSLPFMPIIMVTAKTDSKDVVAGLEAGGDEYLTKPVDHAALVARVNSMLRIKALQDTVVEQSSQLQIQLETATKIQSLFWPAIPDIGAGGHIWAVSIPAIYVAGDLYDIIPLPDGSLLAYVADVSGKGVAAALIMAALSTKIRSEALLQSEPDRLLDSVNTTFHSLTSEEGFFATIVLARYWPVTGIMHIVTGGHFPPLWVSGGRPRTLPLLRGISLGMMPDTEYKKIEMRLSRGESIMFYSDGVIEAENENKELFGNDRLADYIKRAQPPPYGEGLLRRIDKWRGGSPVSDDITILEIWRNGR